MRKKSRNHSAALHRLNARQLRYFKSRSKLLTQRQLDCMKLYHFEDLTEYEVAERLGVCQGTVSRALKVAREVLETGKPSMYYRRADRKEIEWSVARRNATKVKGTVVQIMQMRFRDHCQTSEIAKELGLTQPQVSNILTACGMILADAA